MREVIVVIPGAHCAGIEHRNHDRGCAATCWILRPSRTRRHAICAHRQCSNLASSTLISLPHRQPEQRQDHDAGQQLIGLHQIAGLQHEGADAELGADHFRAHHQQQRDRRRDAKAREDRGQRARPDHAAHDGMERHIKALRHPDQVARHRIDAAIDRDRGGEEHAERNGRDLRLLADPEPEDQQRQQRDLRESETAPR